MSGHGTPRRGAGLERAGLLRPRDVANAAEFKRVADQLRQERLTAERVVPMIRRMVAARVPVSLPAEWIMVGVAEKLSEACGEVVAHSPAEARALAECGLTVASRLSDSYPQIIWAGTVARAWTDLAAAQCAGGDARTALASLDRADEALGDRGVFAHDRAIVDVARAVTLHALGRDEEALALLDDARKTCSDFGDRRRAEECERLKGVIGRAAGGGGG